MTKQLVIDLATEWVEAELSGTDSKVAVACERFVAAVEKSDPVFTRTELLTKWGELVKGEAAPVLAFAKFCGVTVVDE